MLLKRLIGLVFAGALIFSAAAGEIVVRIGPPHGVSERRSRAPGRDYVWISGYHRWDGTRTRGPQEGGNSPRGHMPAGLRIVGITEETAGF